MTNSQKQEETKLLEYPKPINKLKPRNLVASTNNKLKLVFNNNLHLSLQASSILQQMEDTINKLKVHKLGFQPATAQKGPHGTFGLEQHPQEHPQGFEHRPTNGGYNQQAQGPQPGSFQQQPLQAGPHGGFGQPGSQPQGFEHTSANRAYLPPGTQQLGGQSNGNSNGRSFEIPAGAASYQGGANGGHAASGSSPALDGSYTEEILFVAGNVNGNLIPGASPSNGDNFNYNAQAAHETSTTVPAPYNGNHPTNGKGNHENAPRGAENGSQGPHGAKWKHTPFQHTNEGAGRYYGAAAKVLPFQRANGQQEFGRQVSENQAGSSNRYAGPFAQAKIVRFDINPHAGDGSYNYAYETDNGIAAQEEGFLRDGSQVHKVVTGTQLLMGSSFPLSTPPTKMDSSREVLIGRVGRHLEVDSVEQRS
nr:unnamed protein product [Callosobruchus chinensis]